MKIRRGVAEDMERVHFLIKELAIFENEPEAVEVTVEDLIRDGFSNNPLFRTFIAEVNGEIVGLALFYFRYSTWKGKTIHMEDLIVTQNYRGRGIGMALYKEIIKEGAREGVKRIEWNVLDWNTNAIDFYKKTGANVFDDWRVVQLNEEGIKNFDI